MILALLLAVMSAYPDFEATVGGAVPDVPPPNRGGPTAPLLGLRAGFHASDHLTLSGAFLGVLGPTTEGGFCGGGSNCNSSGAFSAISWLGLLRLHTAGDLQGFIEGGVGGGKLKSWSPSDSDRLENPTLHGRVGPVLFVGAGARYFVARTIPVGLELAWTRWTNVSRPSFPYGVSDQPAVDDLTVNAYLLMFTFGFTPGR